MRGENSDKGGAFKKFAVAAGLSVLVAAIFDLLFYGCSGINLNAALFLLALFILGVPIKKGYYNGKARIATVTVTAVFLLSAFWDANLINVFGTLTGLLIIRFGALYGDNSRTLGWLPRLFLYCSTFWADLIVYLSDNAKKFSFNAVRLAFVSLTVFVTAVLAVVFFSLFAVASPQISSILSRLGEMLSDFDLNFPRAVLWAVITVSAFSFLTMHIYGAVFGRTKPASQLSEAPKKAVPEIARYMPIPLAVFNLIFAVQTFFDAKYFADGLKLPSGITYSAFAIDGTAALAFATLIAAAFIVVCLWGGGEGRAWKISRTLVYVWLAQNFLLCVTACARLCMYTRAYDLTDVRIFGFSFFALVLAGLVFTVVKIAKDKTVRWLADRCVYSVVAYALFWSFFDAKRFAADYNTDRFISGANGKIDRKYLSRVGVSSLPARLKLYAHLNGNGHFSDIPSFAEAVINDERSLAKSLEDWRTFSFRNLCILKAIEKPMSELCEIENSKPKQSVSAGGGETF